MGRLNATADAVSKVHVGVNLPLRRTVRLEDTPTTYFAGCACSSIYLFWLTTPYDAAELPLESVVHSFACMAPGQKHATSLPGKQGCLCECLTALLLEKLYQQMLKWLLSTLCMCVLIA